MSEAFWGVVVGSLLALGGVVLSNRANLRNLRAQFEHDRNIRTKERELALRKEVYLEVAEAIYAATECLAKFSDLDSKYDNIVGAYTSKSPAIAKTYVIGGDQVVATIATLTGKVGAAILHLSVRHAELVESKREIGRIQARIDRSNAEASRFLELMQQHTIAGSTDRHHWDVLDQNFEFEQQLVTENNQAREALVDELRPQHIQFISECVQESHALWEYIMPALFAVRNELELPIDETATRAVFARSVQDMNVAIAEFTRRLQGHEVEVIVETEGTARSET